MSTRFLNKMGTLFMLRPIDKFHLWMTIGVLVMGGIVWCAGGSKEPTIALTAKEWECVAWRATSVASAETECTVYWRIK